ncbi:hypothetical protein [Micromonospora carbonacea]|uniref:Uncharacterized protein n=1 Tax=Micromonospora carbonacea TaxID=47853 RepID=A0A1C5ABF3_9ACTN|nr:hypothetical protein [Micromonospora carbonacea]SCF42568.1 hypothetical protein GA0070563_11296 [Micromonospora carbonacea]
MSRHLELLAACLHDMRAQVGPEEPATDLLTRKETRAAEYAAKTLQELGVQARVAKANWLSMRAARWIDTALLEEMRSVHKETSEKWKEAHEAYRLVEELKDLFWTYRNQRYRGWETRRSELADKLRDALAANSDLRDEHYLAVPRVPQLQGPSGGVVRGDCQYCGPTRICDC